MASIEDQLADLDARVRRLEQAVAGQPGGAGASAARRAPAVAAPATRGASAAALPAGLRAAAEDTHARPGGTTGTPVTVTRILGLGGAAALVMAAIYFVRLAIDAGWLTPQRQVGLAALFAVGLIWTGLTLRKANRSYASLLPAAGIVILFVTVFGAHLHYELVGAPLATGAIATVCMLALWLGRIFATNLYVLFAVVGAYLTPFLLPAWHANLLDLLVYYSAWSLLFCGYAIWVGGRSSYLLAMYLALIGFDLIWRVKAQPQWSTTAVFQAVQFLIFVFTAAVYSIRHGETMTRDQAMAHAPGLLIFYVVEYFILGSFVPEWAPWIAIGSAVVLALAYVFATAYLRKPSTAGQLLVTSYAALVLFHAVYIDLVPSRWAPWFALAMLIGLGATTAIGGTIRRSLTPFAAVISVMVIVTFLQLVTGYEIRDVPGAGILSVCFAVALYFGYAMLSDDDAIEWLRGPLLYAAHLAAMLTVFRVVDASLMVSVLWGLIAVGCLLIALVLRDRILGQSSLLIFALSGMKVLLYDLAGSPAPVRIGVLVVLGVTLYIGGWLYQKLGADDGAGEPVVISGADAS